MYLCLKNLASICHFKLEIISLVVYYYRLENFRTQGSQSPTFEQAPNGVVGKRKSSVGGNSSIASEDVASIDSRGDPIVERKGRDEEFEELLEKYNVDEIEEKPKHFYSSFCNRWISISGVSY